MYIDQLSIWANQLSNSPTNGAPNRLELSNNLWNNGWLEGTPVATQHINQLFHLLSGAILEIGKTDDLYDTFFDKMFPVGTIYTVTGNSDNPAELLGRGSWVAYAEGRVVVGVGEGVDAEGGTRGFSDGDTSGNYTNTLVEENLPEHTHQVVGNVNPAGEHSHDNVPLKANNQFDRGQDNAASNYSLDNDGSTGTEPDHAHSLDIESQPTGSGSPVDNLQPYVTAYMWRRVS